MTRLIRICRLGLALLFAYAAWTKIADPAAFARAISGYGLLPVGWVSPAAIVLPWVELAVAAALLGAGDWRRAGALLAMVLLAVFALAIGWNLALGREVACGCFSSGRFGGPATWGHVAGNLAACLAAWLAGAEPAVRLNAAARSPGRPGSGNGGTSGGGTRESQDAAGGGGPPAAESSPSNSR